MFRQSGSQSIIIIKTVTTAYMKNKRITLSKIICITLYYCFAQYLPLSYSLFGGKISKKIRYTLVKHIFKKCGTNVNVERKADFGFGLDIEIGNNSGIGYKCKVPSNIIIGENVMMGPNCIILNRNHSFDSKSIPMNQQGYKQCKPTIIEDDVWIGTNVIMTPSRHISKGSIVGAGCVLCKDFPEYSIIGGNPSKLIRFR